MEFQLIPSIVCIWDVSWFTVQVTYRLFSLVAFLSRDTLFDQPSVKRTLLQQFFMSYLLTSNAHKLSIPAQFVYPLFSVQRNIQQPKKSPVLNITLLSFFALCAPWTYHCLGLNYSASSPRSYVIILSDEPVTLLTSGIHPYAPLKHPFPCAINR